jgi:hypothetical protein
MRTSIYRIARLSYKAENKSCGVLLGRVTTFPAKSIVFRMLVNRRLFLFLCLPLTLLRSAAPPDERCVNCHPAESHTQPQTGMAQALVPAAESAIFRTHQQLSFGDRGYEYQLQNQGDTVLYSVDDAKQKARVSLQWAFGAGTVGQTYLFKIDSQFYEAHVSYYKTLDGLAVTTGHSDLPVHNLVEAAGRLLSSREVSQCFGCHATTRNASLTAGIQCDACHEGAAEHATSVTEKSASPFIPKRLSELTSLAMADRCGFCHRSFQAVSERGPHTLENVRFQPYRLVGSRCFNANDRRISCVACHNPHENVDTRAGAYDSKCQACHQTSSTISGIKLCPVAATNCVTCHMPKVEYPPMHYEFTDHRIRVVLPGVKFPE